MGLTLLDGNGKVRILLNVQSDGKSVLQFLDGSGEVVSELQGRKSKSDFLESYLRNNVGSDIRYRSFRHE